ncbi:hypothetical protein CHS0354_014964 [Potamilus streckersoni]|uniref:Uncharacterized protein n=1 Tax=Potamilus streckersoni TaxID=2493646 RepID=A0AAE0SEF2_9BIVA|nr:hypothetical protein CHS0354_014964 [Potamilus streckersoni]
MTCVVDINIVDAFANPFAGYRRPIAVHSYANNRQQQGEELNRPFRSVFNEIRSEWTESVIEKGAKIEDMAALDQQRKNI